jgi:hypothetical protein
MIGVVTGALGPWGAPAWTAIVAMFSVAMPAMYQKKSPRTGCPGAGKT